MKEGKFIKDTITFEHAKLMFRNFTGREGRFNAAGVRSFNVVIEDEEFAQQLENDGWNIQWPKSQPEDRHLYPTVPVAVRFDDYPPRIRIRQEGSPDIWASPDTVHMLDDADILDATVVIRPYNWNLSDGSSGVKAYLKDMKVEIERDIFCD